MVTGNLLTFSESDQRAAKIEVLLEQELVNYVSFLLLELGLVDNIEKTQEALTESYTGNTYEILPSIYRLVYNPGQTSSPYPWPGECTKGGDRLDSSSFSKTSVTQIQSSVGN